MTIPLDILMTATLLIGVGIIFSFFFYSIGHRQGVDSKYNIICRLESNLTHANCLLKEARGQVLRYQGHENSNDDYMDMLKVENKTSKSLIKSIVNLLDDRQEQEDLEEDT